MKYLFAAILVMALSGTAGAATLPQSAQNNQTIKVFRNVSGSTQGSGTAYILQDANTDANVLLGQHTGSEISIGMDVTTTTSADSGRFVGCQVDASCGDDQLCRVVTHGPAICKWAGSKDNTDTRMATVGTTTVAGQLGSGTLAGLSMTLSLTENDTDSEAEEHAGLTDGEYRWIWISPDNN